MIIVSEYLSEKSFRGLRAYEMANTFSKQQDTNVTIFFYDPSSDFKYTSNNIVMQKNIDYIKIMGRKHFPRFLIKGWMINPISLICYVPTLKKEVDGLKPDVLITITPPFITAIATFIVSKITNLPFCIDIKDNWIDGNIMEYYFNNVSWLLKIEN